MSAAPCASQLSALLLSALITPYQQRRVLALQRPHNHGANPRPPASLRPINTRTPSAAAQRSR
jgi:hypothetical protein